MKQSITRLPLVDDLRNDPDENKLPFLGDDMTSHSPWVLKAGTLIHDQL